MSSRLLTSTWYSENPKPSVVCYDSIQLPELDKHSASHDHNACLRLLMSFADIPADEANAEVRANALAATMMLRSYEQLHNRHPASQAVMVLSPAALTHRPRRQSLPERCISSYVKTPRYIHLLTRHHGQEKSRCTRRALCALQMTLQRANRVTLRCADVSRFCFGSSVDHAGTRADIGTHEAWTAQKVLDDR